MPARHTPGAISPTASPDDVTALFRAEKLSPHRWENGPGDVYAPHRHAYHKVLYCLRGSLRFVLTQEGTMVELRAGDRLDLEPATEHSAVVGPDGVVCLEAAR